MKDGFLRRLNQLRFVKKFFGFPPSKEGESFFQLSKNMTTGALKVFHIAFLCTVSSAVATMDNLYTPSPSFVVDGHVHLTDTSKFAYLWANSSAGICPCAPPCLCNWTMTEYRAAASTFPAASVVFVEVDVTPSQWLQEATWAAGLEGVDAVIAQKPPGFGVDGTNMTDLLQDFQQLAAIPKARGIRFGGISFGQTAIEHLQIFAASGLTTVDVLYSVWDPSAFDVTQFIKLANTLMNLTFVLDHAGSPPVLGSAENITSWKSALKLLSQGTSNVVIKGGGVLQAYKSTEKVPTCEEVGVYIHHILDVFGYERVLYEGNWFFVNWILPPRLDMLQYWDECVSVILRERNATEGESMQYLSGTGKRAYNV